MRKNSFWEWPMSVPAAAVAMLMALAISPSSYAEVKPGDFITRDNATQVKDLLSPGVYYKVEHGMSMKIVRLSVSTGPHLTRMPRRNTPAR